MDVAREVDREAPEAENPALLGVWLQKPSLRHVTGRLHVVTIEGRYRDATGRLWHIPVDTQTDGASVPRPLWWLYPPFGEPYEPAVVLHDDVYARAEQFPGKDTNPLTGLPMLSRGEADDLMREASEAAGFRDSGRGVMHAGVRLGGRWAWKRHRKAARKAGSL